MKFKAKAAHTINQLKIYGMHDHEAHLGDGWVQGYHVDGYIVGRFIEVNNEYTSLEYWIPVDKSTLQIVETDE